MLVEKEETELRHLERQEIDMKVLLAEVGIRSWPFIIEILGGYYSGAITAKINPPRIVLQRPSIVFSETFVCSRFDANTIHCLSNKQRSPTLIMSFSMGTEVSLL